MTKPESTITEGPQPMIGGSGLNHLGLYNQAAGPSRVKESTTQNMRPQLIGE